MKHHNGLPSDGARTIMPNHQHLRHPVPLQNPRKLVVLEVALV
jgi:hypothetical protein